MKKFSTITAALFLGIISTISQASLTLLSGPPVGSHIGNLVVDGSFEAGPPSANVFWATGTSNTPFGVPPGWTSVGPASNYARWGHDSVAPPSIVNSARFPDGVKGLYFGDFQSATSNQTPAFNADGTVTFPNPSTAVVGNSSGGPVVLSQSVPTDTNVAPSYILSFWTSGEGAITGGALDGIFGLRVTNTEAGDPFHYLTAPGGGGSSLVGSNYRYEFSFVPLNPSLPVTVEFYNWGHFGFGGGTTELVLDDVMVNPVLPEPTSLSAIGLAGMILLRRKKN